MLRCSLKFNPQSVIRYQQFALWVKMSNISSGSRKADLGNKKLKFVKKNAFRSATHLVLGNNNQEFVIDKVFFFKTKEM